MSRGLCISWALLAALSASPAWAEPGTAEPEAVEPKAAEPETAEPRAEKPAAPPTPAQLETMPEDSFDPIDLLGHVTKLRPRIRLSQDFVVDQQYDDASVDTFTTSLRANVDVPVSRALAFRVVAQGDVNTFDFHGDSDFLDTGRAPNDPFDELFRTALRIEGGYRLTQSWGVFAGTRLSSSWESGSSYADGMQGAGVLGIAFTHGDRFALVVGARANSRLGASGAKFGPFVQFRWRITDQIELASRGIGLKLAYRPSKPLSLFVQGEWRQQSFRLENRGGTIGKGVLRNRTAPVVAGVTWKLAKHWRVRGWAGAEVYQKYTVLNDDRSTLDAATSDGPAFTGRLQVEYRF